MLIGEANFMHDNSDIRELYQEVILDHNKSPRNFGKLDCATHHAEGFNPLCGDHLQIYLQVADGVIRDVRFEGDGCAISKASASLLTSELKGKSLAGAEKLFSMFQDSVTSDVDSHIDPALGKLSVISGVREFPMRVKCATLAMHTIKSALQGVEMATTE